MLRELFARIFDISFTTSDLPSSPRSAPTCYQLSAPSNHEWYILTYASSDGLRLIIGVLQVPQTVVSTTVAAASALPPLSSPSVGILWRRHYNCVPSCVAL